MITQHEAILVFSFVAWLGVLLLAHNKADKNTSTGETIAKIMLVTTVIGFILVYFI